MPLPSRIPYFFFNDTATTEIYTLSLHDALPISSLRRGRPGVGEGDADRPRRAVRAGRARARPHRDRKSTRLNSSHSQISYAVFCLKKKKQGSWAGHSELRRQCWPMSTGQLNFKE